VRKPSRAIVFFVDRQQINSSCIARISCASLLSPTAGGHGGWSSVSTLRRARDTTRRCSGIKTQQKRRHDSSACKPGVEGDAMPARWWANVDSVDPGSFDVRRRRSDYRGRSARANRGFAGAAQRRSCRSTALPARSAHSPVCAARDYARRRSRRRSAPGDRGVVAARESNSGAGDEGSWSA